MMTFIKWKRFKNQFESILELHKFKGNFETKGKIGRKFRKCIKDMYRLQCFQLLIILKQTSCLHMLLVIWEVLLSCLGRKRWDWAHSASKNEIRGIGTGISFLRKVILLAFKSHSSFCGFFPFLRSGWEILCLRFFFFAHCLSVCLPCAGFCSYPL